MNLQYDNQSQNDSQPQVIDKLFHQKKEVHAKFFPTISNLHDLALRTQDEQIELGVSLYTTSEGAQNATYGIGNASSIFEPTPPLELKGKIRSGVFVHCHPIHESERAVGGGKITTYIT